MNSIVCPEADLFSGILINDGLVSGWALDRHTQRTGNAAAGVITRTELGELFYGYRYRGEDNLRRIVDALAQGIERLFVATGTVPEALLFVPPASRGPEYERIIRLSSRVSLKTGIVSAQPAIVRSSGSTVFSVHTAAADLLVRGRDLLVMDDILRTGRTLRSLCGILLTTAGAASVRILVGTTARHRDEEPETASEGIRGRLSRLTPPPAGKKLPP